jgi:alpha-ribazole phosphatase
MDGICYGRSDVSLADDYLVSFHNIETDTHYDQVISSPLKRCTILTDYLKHPYNTDARLQEVNFGSWELKKWDDIERKDFDLWHLDYVNTAPPQGESLAVMQNRVLSLLFELKKNHPNGKVLLITHAGVIRIILSYIERIPLKDIFSIKIGFGELRKVNF